jgi:hypothetical protein
MTKRATDVPILISWYMTPFAILLVFLGVYYGKPEGTNAMFAIAIVLSSALMNVTSVLLMQQSPERMVVYRNFRVVLNYVANFILLCLLIPVWPEVWMLMLLMAIATAIYGSLQSTYIHCIAFGALLFGISYLTGELGGIKTGQTLMHVLALFFLAPFINRLVEHYKPESTGGMI